jgi:hypothetical protein
VISVRSRGSAASRGLRTPWICGHLRRPLPSRGARAPSFALASPAGSSREGADGSLSTTSLVATPNLGAHSSPAAPMRAPRPQSCAHRFRDHGDADSQTGGQAHVSLQRGGESARRWLEHRTLSSSCVDGNRMGRAASPGRGRLPQQQPMRWLRRRSLIWSCRPTRMMRRGHLRELRWRKSSEPRSRSGFSIFCKIRRRPIPRVQRRSARRLPWS